MESSVNERMERQGSKTREHNKNIQYRIFEEYLYSFLNKKPLPAKYYIAMEDRRINEAPIQENNRINEIGIHHIPSIAPFIKDKNDNKTK